MPEYKSKYTGAEIDALLDKVDGRTSTPAPAEDKLITSGGVYTGLAGKTDKVTSPTAGNFPKLKADGSLEDSGKKPSDFVEKEAGKGLSSNNYTDAEKTKLGALPTKADLDTELDAKADKDTDATEGNLAVFDSNGNPVDAGESLDDINERLLDLSKPGFCEGLVDTISAGTEQEIVYRQSSGDGVNCIKRIKGKTIAWNQLADGKMSSSSQGLTIDYTDDVFTIDGTTTNSWVPNVIKCNTINGHKYLISSTIISGSGSGRLYNGNGAATAVAIGSSGIYEPTGDSTYLGISTYSGEVFSQLKMKVIVTDLTLLGLGDLTATQFKALFPLPYYPYNAGVLNNNDAAALLTDGFNQWDEVWESGAYDTNGEPTPAASYIRSKNLITVTPSSTYYFLAGSSVNTATIFFYDADGNFISYTAGNAKNSSFTTPANCHKVHFCVNNGGTTYQNNICVNLSDASRNGQYEPYWKREIQFRIKEVTGVPVGGTEADRVTIFPEGAAGAGSAFDSIFMENGVTKAKKAMARVDLGTPNWTHDDAYGRFITASLVGLIKDGVRNVGLVCPKYAAIMDGRAFDASWNKVIYSVSGSLIIHDSSYPSETTGAQFKAAISGVYLEYELATPVVYTDLRNADGSPFSLPMDILVDELGVEKAIFPESADGSPSAPLRCDSTYSISIANLVKKLNTL